MTATHPREVVPLTDRQMEIYRYLFNQTMANGYQPSMRELMDAFGISSPNGVVGQLGAMVRKGWITSKPNASRCLTFHLTPDGRPFAGFVCREESP